MKKHKVTILPSAMDDIQELVHYIALDSNQAAQKMAQSIFAGIRKLAEFPMMGVCAPDPVLNRLKTRIQVVEPYYVFYTTQAEEVIVLRVVHMKRDALSIMKAFFSDRLH